MHEWWHLQFNIDYELFHGRFINLQKYSGNPTRKLICLFFALNLHMICDPTENVMWRNDQKIFSRLLENRLLVCWITWKLLNNFLVLLFSPPFFPKSNTFLLLCKIVFHFLLVFLFFFSILYCNAHYHTTVSGLYSLTSSFT